MEPFAGLQGEPQHVAFGIGQLHHIGLYPQQRKLLLLLGVHREHKELDGEPHLPLSAVEVVAVDLAEHLTAHTGLHTCRVVPQPHRHHGADLSFQAQAGRRSRAVV